MPINIKQCSLGRARLPKLLSKERSLQLWLSKLNFAKCSNTKFEIILDTVHPPIRKWIKSPCYSTFRSCLAWVEQDFQNCWTRSDLCNYVWASWVLRSATTKEGYILRFIITGLDLFSYPRVAFSPPSHPQGCRNVKTIGGGKPLWWA